MPSTQFLGNVVHAKNINECNSDICIQLISKVVSSTHLIKMEKVPTSLDNPSSTSENEDFIFRCKYCTYSSASFNSFKQHITKKGRIDLLSHFMKLKCDFWTYFSYVMLVANTCLTPIAGIPWVTSTAQKN